MFGFGRRKIEVHPEDMYAMILYQVGALKAMLDAEEVPLSHIKPHGELFFYMQRDLDIMDAVLRACAVFGVPVFGAKGTEHQKAMCEKYGLVFVEEAYTDLQYNTHRKLMPASESKLATVDDVYSRTKLIGLQDLAADNEGHAFKMGFDGQPFLFCIHSDMPTALENAKACREAIDEINAKRGW
jgi:lactam utilization protein B